MKNVQHPTEKRYIEVEGGPMTKGKPEMSESDIQRQDQSAADKVENSKTIKIQKAGNGFIVRPHFGNPMVFLTFKEAAEFIEECFMRKP